jgi:hypothetical protein
MKHVNDRLLVFAHMMKTAGTSLSKQLIAHFGGKMHIVSGGLKMDDDYYNKTGLEQDLALFNQKLKIITGHPMRPYIDFGKEEQRMVWFTFFREPKKRYVSHYLHDFKWSGDFSKDRYKGMKDKSIIEWEKLDDYKNYQTRFIAGEDNVDKAIEILESKFSWLGITEEYETSMHSFRSYFDLNHLHIETTATNTNLADKDTKNEVHEIYSDFIAEMNQNDIELYEYVKNQIWPKYKKLAFDTDNKSEVKTKGRIRRELNTIRFQINRQLKVNETKFNLKNFKRFYNRWYR